MSEQKSIMVLFLLIIIVVLVLKNKNKWFSNSNEVKSDENKSNNVNEELLIILDDVVYSNIETTNVFYLKDNKVLLEYNNTFCISEIVLTKLELNVFLNNNDVVYDFFKINKEEEYTIKNGEDSILLYFNNLDVLFLINSNGFFILQNTTEYKNIKFTFNNKVIKKELLSEFIKNKDVV